MIGALSYLNFYSLSLFCLFVIVPKELQIGDLSYIYTRRQILLLSLKEVVKSLSHLQNEKPKKCIFVAKNLIFLPLDTKYQCVLLINQ